MNYEDALKATVARLPESYKQMINQYNTPMGTVDTVQDSVKMYKKGGKTKCMPSKKANTGTQYLALGGVAKIRHDECDAKGRQKKPKIMSPILTP